MVSKVPDKGRDGKVISFDGLKWHINVRNTINFSAAKSIIVIKSVLIELILIKSTYFSNNLELKF